MIGSDSEYRVASEPDWHDGWLAASSSRRRCWSSPGRPRLRITITNYFVQDDFGVVALLSQKPASYFPRWFVSTWMDDIWGFTPDEIRPFPAVTYQLAALWGADVDGGEPRPQHRASRRQRPAGAGDRAPRGGVEPAAATLARRWRSCSCRCNRKASRGLPGASIRCRRSSIWRRSSPGSAGATRGASPPMAGRSSSSSSRSSRSRTPSRWWRRSSVYDVFLAGSKDPACWWSEGRVSPVGRVFRPGAIRAALAAYLPVVVLTLAYLALRYDALRRHRTGEPARREERRLLPDGGRAPASPRARQPRRQAAVERSDRGAGRRHRHRGVDRRDRSVARGARAAGLRPVIWIAIWCGADRRGRLRVAEACLPCVGRVGGHDWRRVRGGVACSACSQVAASGCRRRSAGRAVLSRSALSIP